MIYTHFLNPDEFDVLYDDGAVARLRRDDATGGYPVTRSGTITHWRATYPGAKWVPIPIPVDYTAEVEAHIAGKLAEPLQPPLDY